MYLFSEKDTCHAYANSLCTFTCVFLHIHTHTHFTSIMDPREEKLGLSRNGKRNEQR